MSRREASLHNFVDCDAQIFGSWNLLLELGKHIQILMVVAFDDLRVDEAIQINKIAHHAGLIIDSSADGDFDHVVVAVAVWIIALAVDVAIFLLRHFVAMEAVRRGKHVAAGEVGFHAFHLMPLISRLPVSFSISFSVDIDEKVGCFVDAHAM
jgi:hypothetical protein